MTAFFDDEKIGIRKIKLLRPESGTMAVVGTFSQASDFLTTWRGAAHGRLQCRFEIEYVDEHVLTGTYRSLRGTTGRVSLSVHIRATFHRMLSGRDATRIPNAAVPRVDIQFWRGQRAWTFAPDFLERYET